MRTGRRMGGVVALLLTAATGAQGQVPGLPGAAPGVAAPPLPGGGVGGATTAGAGAAGGAGGAGLAGAAGAGGGAAPRNIWGFFMKTPEQKAMCRANLAACRARFCQSKFGQIVNGFLAPASAVTGGILGPLCPPPTLGANGQPNGVGAPNPADLAMPANTPQGAAARIKQEENPAVIKAKIEAIQFLATVDCRYYPEAEAGLITGLRAEKNECVRLAAARALASGCCCTPNILKALLTVVNCSKKDGFPAEASELVRTYAFVALERCMQKCVEGEPEPSPEPPPAAKKALLDTLAPLGPTADINTHILIASYFATDKTESTEKLHAAARAALARGLKLSPQTIARLTGPRTVTGAVAPAMPSLYPADVITRLDTVVRNAFTGPRVRSTMVVRSTPQSPQAQPEWLAQPERHWPAASQAVYAAATPDPTHQPRGVMGSESAYPGSLVPVSAPTPAPRPTSVLSLWQSSRRR